MSRARPSTRLASVSPPTDPSERVRFMCSCPPKASEVRPRPAFAAGSPAGGTRPAGLLALLRLQLRHIGRGEIDRIEEQRREAGVRHRLGDDLAREGEEQARRLDEQEGLERFFRQVAKAEQPGVAQVDDEMDAVVRAGGDVDLQR